MGAATVFVIDDEAEVRHGLTRLLRSSGLQVVAHESAQAFIANGPYDITGCILLDVSMPEMTGPELHERLRDCGIGMPDIYLTGQCSVSVGVRAMKNGAFDFLEKPVDADVLLPAIGQALAAYRLTQAEERRLYEIRLRLSTLSPREREALGYVVAGLLNKQIASEMGIAEKTVKVHRGRAMAKMQCRSVAELVRLCGTLDPATYDPSFTPTPMG